MKKTNAGFKRTPIAVALSVLLGATMSSQMMADDESTEEKKKTAAQIVASVIEVYGTKSTTAEASQTVAGSLLALGADQLDARQIVQIEDLAFATPNVALDSVGTSPGVANFSIRGLGINSSIVSVDPHVGVFIDGIYAGVTYGVVTDTFDLESIEIYKGPQGVLFGRNVTGGAVLLRSARPTGKTAGKFKLGLEEDQTTVAGAFEVALSDKVAAKVSVYQKDDDGWFYNSYLKDNVGAEKTQMFRGTVVYEPTDSSEMTVIYEHGKLWGDGAVPQNASLDPDLVTKDEQQAAADLIAANGGSGTFDSIANERGRTDIVWDQVTFEFGVDIGEGRLTNIMGYRAVDSISYVDVDSSPVTLLHSYLDVDQSQFSNEVRYNILVNDTWDLTAGIYYFNQDFTNINGRNRTLLPYWPTPRKYLSGGVQDQTTLGVFMNNSIFLNDNLTLNVGLRYTEEDKDVQVYPWSNVTAGTANGCNWDMWTCSGAETLSTSSSNVSPKLGFEWNRDDDNMMVYGHWVRGFRSEMFNFRPGGAPKATDVEQHDSYEIGVKSTSEDGSLMLNAAIFSNNISDMVRSTNVAAEDGGLIQDVVNTADATINGLELDMILLVNDNLAITAGVGILDGSYDKIRPEMDLNGDGLLANDADLALNIPRLSDLSYNVGITYDMDLGNYGSLAARADYNFRSDAAFTDDNKGNFADLTVVNAGFTFTPNEGNWTVTLYGKNLTNEIVLGGMTRMSFVNFGYPDANRFSPMKKGRRWGVDFNYNF